MTSLCGCLEKTSTCTSFTSWVLGYMKRARSKSKQKAYRHTHWSVSHLRWHGRRPRPLVAVLRRRSFAEIIRCSLELRWRRTGAFRPRSAVRVEPAHTPLLSALKSETLVPENDCEQYGTVYARYSASHTFIYKAVERKRGTAPAMRSKMLPKRMLAAPASVF